MTVLPPFDSPTGAFEFPPRPFVLIASNLFSDYAPSRLLTSKTLSPFSHIRPLSHRTKLSQFRTFRPPSLTSSSPVRLVACRPSLPRILRLPPSSKTERARLTYSAYLSPAPALRSLSSTRPSSHRPLLHSYFRPSIHFLFSPLLSFSHPVTRFTLPLPRGTPFLPSHFFFPLLCVSRNRI